MIRSLLWKIAAVATCGGYIGVLIALGGRILGDPLPVELTMISCTAAGSGSVALSCWSLASHLDHSVSDHNYSRGYMDRMADERARKAAADKQMI